MRFKFELIDNEWCLVSDCTLDRCVVIALLLVNMQYNGILKHYGKAAAWRYRKAILKRLNDPNGKVWEVQNDT